MKILNNSNLSEKNILVRVDLNVPVYNNIIIEKSRIKSIKATVKKLKDNKNKIFLISHFGRPEGKINKKYSLEFLCSILKIEFSANKIFFLKNLKDEEIKKTISIMNPGNICLVENIRFYTEEEKNDLKFSKRISKNFDIYINEAFSVSHRKHSSIVGFPKFLPSYAGLSFLEEIYNINLFINNSQKPKMAIIGGSKISTKIDLLYNLIEKCEVIALGGAMANTFLYAKGFCVGSSLCEKNLIKSAIKILKKAKKWNCKIILPSDVVCANSLEDNKIITENIIENIPHNQMILDVGSKTVSKISNSILRSKAILWNGPLGAFECSPFERSSVEIANVIKKISDLETLTIAGGGDTVSVIKMAKAQDAFSYISNAGGAFLEWLEGKSSPGVDALK